MKNNDNLPEVLCRLQNVSKYFGRRVGLVDVSFDIVRGNIYCVCGANAAGKSTLVNVISGLLKPDKGKISHLEIDKTGVMLHKSMLYPELTVAENLRFYANLYRIKDKKGRISMLLEKLALKDFRNDKVDILSAGVKKRVSFARAIINCPNLILLDEPFSGLDKDSFEIVVNIIKESARSNTAVILTTHRIDKAAALADYFYVLDNGRMVMNKESGDIDREKLCKDYLFLAKERI
jgi:heme exporter protein A